MGTGSRRDDNQEQKVLRERDQGEWKQVAGGGRGRVSNGAEASNKVRRPHTLPSSGGFTYIINCLPSSTSPVEARWV